MATQDEVKQALLNAIMDKLNQQIDSIELQYLMKSYIDLVESDRSTNIITLLNDLNANNKRIQNLSDPVNYLDGTNKNYVDIKDQVIAVDLANHKDNRNNPHQVTLEQARSINNQLAGDINANGNLVKNLGTPVDDNDAARKTDLANFISKTADYDSGWITAAPNESAIMLTHNLGVAPRDVRLLIRNDDTGSIRVTTSQYMIYTDSYGYYGQSITRITNTYISVYSGGCIKLGGSFAMKYDGSNAESDTNNISIRVLAWK